MAYQGYQPYSQLQMSPAYGQNQYQNPYQLNGGATAPQNIARQDVPKVSGRNGAEMFPLGPNSSILLMDETAPMVWLKVTDGGGYPTLTPYDITPHQAEKPVDLQSLEDRITRIEEELSDGKKSNGDRAKHSEVDASESGKN